MEGLGGALHTCVAGIDREPGVLKHKYHRHLNHKGPEVGFGGFRQLSLFWGGGSSQGALSTPPPPIDHAPVTRGRMRAQFPLPHGPN